ncbi:MAG: pyruvate kinase [Rickettsiales bacterium]|jgi:pyruvate kinase|nr:pyruvate kinase [Rickettsiales bacterium]
MKRFTKITSSIGPASESKDMLIKMIETGVNVCRLNFSHDTGEAQGKKIDIIREYSAETGNPVAVLADLQGPKHRIGNFETEDKYPIEVGQKFILDNDPTSGNSQRVQLPDMDVIKSLKVGDRVLLNDGKIELKVENVNADSVETAVVRGTQIWSRRGFNLPDTEVATSVLTQKDREDLEYILTKKPDFIAISFVQRPEDIVETREFIRAHTKHPVKIVAKIERPNAVERIEDIVEASDAVMIARGDLAVEMPFEQVPAVSRRIIRVCRENNKPVIMATQMLGSMVDSEFPTRAEISDIATAAYLQVDSTMTSEETTISANPAKVVETMAKILTNADQDSIENGQDWLDVENIPENDWSLSVVTVAELNEAQAIIVFTHDGQTATKVACRRPNIPIIAVCNECVVANQLCLSRGVASTCDSQLFDLKDAVGAARMFNINEGNLVIVDKEKISLRRLG